MELNVRSTGLANRASCFTTMTGEEQPYHWYGTKAYLFRGELHPKHLGDQERNSLDPIQQRRIQAEIKNVNRKQFDINSINPSKFTTNLDKEHKDLGNSKWIYWELQALPQEATEPCHPCWATSRRCSHKLSIKFALKCSTPTKEELELRSSQIGI